ncbi:conjugative transposon protein TraM [Mucilaginibacter terrae]|uniref:Conjugative transposon TraM C-terminal domain-containing protein n=1 Tax=Mucilaginibacter terrae TaxID=1955052 RepID=A0ABU3GRQ0_9SPHI|nr:conjugative transposon protein TraM [Mucilaginibacter terrae]MDT3402325.1 hypothetical protein [Mucilaginibacter terrae]
MNSKPITPQLQRQRKLLLLLPAIALPFLTLLFWSMKSKNDDAGHAQSAVVAGLNTHLPSAHVKDSGSVDKLSFYEQADADARRRSQERQQDPYSRTSADPLDHSAGITFNNEVPAHHPGNVEPGSTADANEQKIYARLNSITQAMNREPEPVIPKRNLRKEFRSMSDGNAARPQEDPELKQMNAIMEKLVQLQHPETVKPASPVVNAVTRQFRAIPAIIDGKQRITDNTVIRMKLLDSATVNGQFFRKGQPVFAAGMFSNQRMKLDIRSIHIGNVIYPVDLTVFDAEDGLEGVSVPDAVTNDALRNGATTGVQSMDLMNLDPSLSAQLATAGVNTAKGLFSKKVKRIKAKLQDKRPILLRVNQPVLVQQDATETPRR